MKKNRIIVLLSAALLTCVAAATTLFANKAQVRADGDITISAKMEFGAATRVASTQEDTGIRYQMRVSESVYEALTKDGSEYSNVSFGVFVAPYETYYKVHSFDNQDTLLEYYTWEGDSRTDISGKAEIINVCTEGLARVDASGDDPAHYLLTASVINMKGANLLTEYIGIGYIKYTLNEVETYVFAGKNDNVRSMTYIFQKALENGFVSEQTAGYSFFLSDSIKNTETDYSVERYFEQGDGYYKQDEAKTKTVSAKIASAVNYAESDAFSGYEFDSSNANNVSQGTVYANGRLTLRSYYKIVSVSSADAGIVSALEGDGTLDLSDMQQGLNVTLTKYIDVDEKVNNDEYKEHIDISTEEVAVNNGKLSLSGLEGQYLLKGAKSDGTVVYTKKFEATSSAAPVWNNSYDLTATHLRLVNGELIKDETDPKPTAEIVQDVGGRTGSYYQLKDNDARFEFSVLPLHSKGYYEQYKDYVLSADVYVAEYAETVTRFNLLVFGSDTEKYDGVLAKGKWATYITVGNDSKVNTVGRYLDSWGAFFHGYAKSGGSALSMLGYSAYDNSSWGGKKATLYFGNVQIVPNVTVSEDVATEAELVDIESVTSYDVTDAITSDDNKTCVNTYPEYTAWSLTNNRNSEVISGTGKTISLEGLKHGVYTLKVTVAGKPVFSGEIDLYKESVVETFDIADALTEKFFATYGSVSSEIVDIATVEGVAGDRTGNYLKIDVTTNRPMITIKPLHSKAYYEKYKDYTLSFDLFVVDPKDNTVLFQVNVCNFNNGEPGASDKNITLGEWHTCSSTVQFIVDNYENLANKAPSSNPVNYICDVANAYYDADDKTNKWSGSTFVCYFGNVIATAPIDAE